MTDLYRLAQLREGSVRQAAERATLVAPATEPARSAGPVRVHLAKLLVTLATRLSPESATGKPGARPAMGGVR